MKALPKFPLMLEAGPHPKSPRARTLYVREFKADRPTPQTMEFMQWLLERITKGGR